MKETIEDYIKTKKLGEELYDFIWSFLEQNPMQIGEFMAVIEQVKIEMLISMLKDEE